MRNACSEVSVCKSEVLFNLELYLLLYVVDLLSTFLSHAPDGEQYIGEQSDKACSQQVVVAKAVTLCAFFEVSDCS